jgi:hypothetical protein
MLLVGPHQKFHSEENFLRFTMHAVPMYALAMGQKVISDQEEIILINPRSLDVIRT